MKLWSLGSIVVFALVGLSQTKQAHAQESKIENARAAVKANPADMDAQFTLGRVLRRAGKSSDAIVALKAATIKGGANDNVRYELMRANADLKDFQAASQACRGIQTAALKHACNAEAVVVIRKLGSDASPEIEKALKLDNTLYEANYALGLVQSLDGKVVEAEKAFRDAINKDSKRTEARVGLAQLLETSSRAEKAVDELRLAVKADADDIEAQYELGRLLGMTAEARDALVVATQGRLSFPSAWGRLAEVQLALGKVPEAIIAAEKAIKDEPNHAVWNAVVAEAKVSQKKYDEALAAANVALAASSTNGRAKLAWADAMAGKGDIDSAIDAYSAAFGLLRTDPNPLVRGAKMCLNFGRDTSAKGFSDKVTATFPKWGPGWDVAGDVAKKSGDKAAAKNAWQKALTGEGPIDKTAIQAKIDAL